MTDGVQGWNLWGQCRTLNKTPEGNRAQEPQVPGQEIKTLEMNRAGDNHGSSADDSPVLIFRHRNEQVQQAQSVDAKQLGDDSAKNKNEKTGSSWKNCCGKGSFIRRWFPSMK